MNFRKNCTWGGRNIWRCEWAIVLAFFALVLAMPGKAKAEFYADPESLPYEGDAVTDEFYLDMVFKVEGLILDENGNVYKRYTRDVTQVDMTMITTVVTNYKGDYIGSSFDEAGMYLMSSLSTKETQVLEWLKAECGAEGGISVEYEEALDYVVYAFDADGNQVAADSSSEVRDGTYVYTVTYSVVDENIKPFIIEVEQTKPVMVVKGLNNYVDEDGDTIYRYNMDTANFTIRYSDGMVCYGTPGELKNYFGIILEEQCEQKHYPWKVGHNTAVLWIDGVNYDLDILVKEVESFTFEEVGYNQEVDGEWVCDSGNYVFKPKFSMDDMHPRITFTDGEKLEGMYSYLMALYDFTEAELLANNVGSAPGIYENGLIWKIGDFTVPATIKISPTRVTSVTMDPITLTEEDGVWLDEDGMPVMSGGTWKYYPLSPGSFVFYITWVTGSEEICTGDELLSTMAKFYNYDDQSEENPWLAGHTYYEHVHIYGVDTTIAVTIQGDETETPEVPIDPDPETPETPEVPEEPAYQSEWILKDGKWYYYDEDGKVLTAKKEVEGRTYLFDADGVMQSGWKLLGDKWYYFGNDMARSWKKIDGSWYYFNNEGVMQSGWQQIGGTWYYLNNTMVTGWKQIQGKWYYFGSDGAMKTYWQQVNGKWYYLGGDGSMRSGWAQVSGKWYYLGSDGAMRSGWVQVSGKWYYLGSDGAMRTNWQQVDGGWYFFGGDGAMRSGWALIEGKWYYFDPANASKMVASKTMTIDGKSYTFGADGAWIH